MPAVPVLYTGHKKNTLYPEPCTLNDKKACPDPESFRDRTDLLFLFSFRARSPDQLEADVHTNTVYLSEEAKVRISVVSGEADTRQVEVHTTTG